MSEAQAAHRVVLQEPAVGEHEVRFAWELTPRSELYHADGFSLVFPPALDLARVPRGLWLRLAMLCLHTHWALLRPCMIELPFYLGPGEREFWLRMIDTAALQISACGGKTGPGRAADLIDEGPSLRPEPVAAPADRAAAAFSGGKDSLTQAGLLAELTERPLLVTTTSPVEWAHDHVGPARARTLSSIEERLPAELMEVHSDFRACWDNGFPGREGCVLTVNELTDVLLYQAATLAVAAAAGVPRCFMASEAELQYNAAKQGDVIQHGHFASSAVTLGSVDRLLRGFGLGMGSLTHALHMPQVEGLLWRRYRSLTDLQFSCWEATDGSQACSTCAQCFEVAVVILAEGHSPRRAGIDPVRLLRAWSDPRPPDPRRPHLPVLHPARVPRDTTARIIQAMPVERVREILREDPATSEDDVAAALEGYTRLQARSVDERRLAAPGYIAEFLELVDEDLRQPLGAIFEEYFEPAAEAELSRMFRRSRSLRRWITDPLVRADGLRTAAHAGAGTSRP